MAQQIIVLAGAAGDLGTRIARSLVERAVTVRALVRQDLPDADRHRLAALGATPTPVNAFDIGSVAAVCEGAACVVSALNGLREVIVERQGVLLDAAVNGGVPRFIPSDYSADFTKTKPGANRNFDLRREFMARAARAQIRVTSILNGAFMEMLVGEIPIIQPRIHRVLYWRDADQPLDFTAKDDVAAYVAAAALDETAPRILRIAGDTVSARQLAALLTDMKGQPFRTLRAGGLGSLSVMIRLARLVAPQPSATFPVWQGMQYLRDMFSGHGKLQPLDNDRYPGLRWTSVKEMLAKSGSTSG